MEMSNSQKAALNNGTANSYLNYLNSYTSFCDEYGYQPFPLNEITLSMFAQYLSQKLKPQSIKCAVSSLRTISNTVGYKTTENQFPMVKLTLRGIGNLKPAPPKRAHPMTARILMNIRENLDLSDRFQATMWALFTTCFFLLFRKSNVTPDKDSETNFMRRKHIRETINGFLITLYWTKTIQAGERCLEFPLLEAPGSPLCPVWAIRNMIKLVPASQESAAFCYKSGQPIAYSTFNNFVKTQIRKLGMSHDSWSTHSFRRGGTTYLAACGLPERQIKILGDWKSDCYKQYIHCPWQDKLKIATKLRSFLMKSMY